MPDSVYKIITLVGTSTESWEKAAATSVEKAAKTLRELRIAEVEDHVALPLHVLDQVLGSKEFQAVSFIPIVV